MVWNESVVEVLRILQAMAGWMAGMVLTIAALLSLVYLIRTSTGR